MNKRIFVQKKPAYDRESQNLKNLLNRDFKLAIKNLKTYVIYDLYNITKDLYEKAKERVFSEVMIDQVFEDIDLNGKTYIAYETLPAQYDQRSDSAMQALKLIDDKADVLVRAGKLVVIDGEVSDGKLGEIKKYLINPIESSEKDLSKMDFSIDSQMKPLRDLTGFRDYGKNELEGLIKDLSLAFDLEDLEFIQDHYKKEGRDPSETEIYVLDVFWSDHCRHTTFETSLDEVKINSKLFQDEMQAAFDYYLSLIHI